MKQFCNLLIFFNIRTYSLVILATLLNIAGVHGEKVIFNFDENEFELVESSGIYSIHPVNTSETHFACEEQLPQIPIFQKSIL